MFFNILPKIIVKYQNLVNDRINKCLKKEKTLYLTGHSKGAFLASNSIYEYSKKPVQEIKGALFSLPYRTVGDFVHLDETINNPNIKKLSFVQDWISNKVITAKKRKNVVMFDNDNFSFVDAHSIERFTNPNTDKYTFPVDDKNDYTIEVDSSGKYSIIDESL